MVRGWLLDLYPIEQGKMVVWVKSDDNRAVRLVDSWNHCIYVAADQKPLLLDLLKRDEIRDLIVDWAFESKFERIVDLEKSEVLRLTLKDARKAQDLAKRIQNNAPFDLYRIYNVDVSPQQAYFYEKELFPLARVEAREENQQIAWELLDSIESTDYEVPRLASLKLRVEVDKLGKLPRFEEPIKSIQVVSKGESVTIDEGSEADKILSLVKTTSEFDPDLIHTDDGDTFTFLYLIRRAEANHLQDQLILSREHIALKWPSKLGNSYFSYGKILYKPASQKLYGRVHVDESNTFIASSCGLHGLIEVARLCRIPIHTALRASIGKCMSSLQFYNATKRDILIPWKPTLAECFKTVWDLMVADRGGFIFEPKLGLHEEVGEIDFSSLYPMIMAKKNISAETVSCRCCQDSTQLVPEVNYHVCRRRRGIVPISLDLVLEKRRIYKELMKSAADSQLRAVYDARQASLKWILVCCFGYLGFHNAKFGRIDAHISVCAYARKILLDAVRIAERNGFSLVHGIVDSLWLKKRGADEEDYENLCEEIRDELGFPISFEGIYKWIAFLPSKVYAQIPVLNRYFGVFRNGEVKHRGIETRRHDTPSLITRFEEETLQTLAKASDLQSAYNLLPSVLQILRSYSDQVKEGRIPLEDLVIQRGMSKNLDEYENNTLQAIAAKQLQREGRQLFAGQTISYVITNYSSKNAESRVLAYELITSKTSYDVARYLELLAYAASTILDPFGYGKDQLTEIVLEDFRQVILS